MTSYCIEVGAQSLNKYGEQLCGDKVEIVENDASGSTVMVLADGLGSGVKASILSTLTAKIISAMMAGGMSVEECVAAVAATLPVCEVRKIAYSTFTIIRIGADMEAEIYQYDNPRVFLLRDGKRLPMEETLKMIGGKAIYHSKVRLDDGDAFVAVSDGVVHAGVGIRLRFGWQLADIITFMEGIYKKEHTAKMLATVLLDQCSALYGGKPGDDTTVCVIKVRRRKQLNLLLGPPANPRDDKSMLEQFFSSPGKHIVCGGTTSGMVADYLGKPLEVDINGYADPAIPPIGKIEGVDLVTEGVVTISHVLEYARDYLAENLLYMQWSRNKDGASQIARMIFEQATDIDFFVGQAINAAHQNPDLPIAFNIKMRLVDNLAEALKRIGKRVNISYF